MLRLEETLAKPLIFLYGTFYGMNKLSGCPWVSLNTVLEVKIKHSFSANDIVWTVSTDFFWALKFSSSLPFNRCNVSCIYKRKVYVFEL